MRRKKLFYYVTWGSNVTRDVHWCVTVDYQQIANDNIANQIHGFTINYSKFILNNNYFMSPSWMWSDKITNERVARVGYNHFISNKGEWNNCFSKFSNRVLRRIFISTILPSGKFLNLVHHFPYDVKLRLFNNYSPKAKWILVNIPRDEVEGNIHQYSRAWGE